ncbi:MAG: class I SAM-dependent DNA methyltransferase [Methylocystis sp.]|nr:class I SAM-dependent DNA methyltransferase [Methylocystis sp.]MCA3585849.1 class I SAM-dependent DNA methyltransferase [Methylocystis sp.]MCA3589143.1 class I SAM-dependent DNA methyltransferase [Methylocystis sp.]MCA3591817.1 class I SAM-dependent DNA methyltransferase [Methylocystis sp.]
MRLDWNDIKARAAIFADEWKDAAYERGETQSFYNDFFALFGVPRRRVASFESGVNLAAGKRGFLDLFWKGKLLVEQKSAGRDLRAAKKQALEYFPGLKDHELPRYILLSDFQTFELYDLDIDAETPLRFRLSELPDHIQAFGFIVGQERRIFRNQDPASIAASEMMGALHDALEDSGYKGHALEQFLVRLLFCLFADDTGIFQPLGIFEEFIKDRTAEDGTDVGPLLMKLFAVLDTQEPERETALDADLRAFPYVNGELFKETLRAPSFNRDMREKLLNVCGFNWEKVSPAIFGSLFQSVMNKAERRKKGAHYTSEKNILKVIEPLFMDDLKVEFDRLKARRDNGRTKALQEFHGRLGSLTFFDPACGCGNFLVIAYRELRELELLVLRELHQTDQLVTDIGQLTRVNVDQFYGIELEEFPARIAEVAMWMMDHIMNGKLSAAFGKAYVRIPLKNSPNIRHGDALEVDWGEVLPPAHCSFVFGNPPFIGQSYQSPAQRAQMARIVGSKRGGSLDYVCAWFLKAGAYVKAAAIPSPSSTQMG